MPLSNKVSQFQKELARKESISCLKYSEVMVEKMSDQQLDINNLKKDLKNDLKRLLKDVKKKDGNPVSKRIVANIDPWLVQQIEIAIESVSEDNPMDELYEDLRGPHPQES